MSEITHSEIIQASAESIWALLEDFGSISSWWPRTDKIHIERVDIEGTGVGMIRHIYNHGVAGCVSERLDLLDTENKVLILSIVGERPKGMTAYVAEGRVEPINDSKCRVHYRAMVTTEKGREEKVRQAILFTWSLMFRGLEAAANTTQ